MNTDSHWVQWHRMYDVAGSPLRQRLAIVEGFVRDALDAAPADGPIRILSLCAGQGRDVIDVVAAHRRRADVHARLVEFDPELGADARTAVALAGLEHIEIVVGDGSTSDAAAGAVPAHIVVACGIFGNISDADIHGFVEYLPALCAPGAVVVWTRHRRPPDLTPTIRDWFAGAGFEEIGFVAPDDEGLVGVGAHRLITAPRPNEAGRRLFTFVGDGGVYR